MMLLKVEKLYLHLQTLELGGGGGGFGNNNQKKKKMQSHWHFTKSLPSPDSLI
jgi:hypothetical protein